MVMFKARFKPASEKPYARLQAQQQQQQQQPQSGAQQQQQPRPKGPQQQQQQPRPKVPPIEEERGPQNPVQLPGQPHEPERAR
jgi:hypothetical protein